MITDKKIIKSAVHRTNITTADAGADISDSAGALTLFGQLHVAVILECSAGGVSGSICLAMWDSVGTFIGISDYQSFVSNSTWRNGASGPYATPMIMFDVAGASKVKMLVRALNGGNITNAYLDPLDFSKMY